MTSAAPLSRDMLAGYAADWLRAVYGASPSRANCLAAETTEAHLTYIFRCGNQFWAARSTNGEDVKLIPLEAGAAQTARLYGSAGRNTFGAVGSLGAGEKARLLTVAKRLSF